MLARAAVICLLVFVPFLIHVRQHFLVCSRTNGSRALAPFGLQPKATFGCAIAVSVAAGIMFELQRFPAGFPRELAEPCRLCTPVFG